MLREKTPAYSFAWLDSRVPDLRIAATLGLVATSHCWNRPLGGTSW